MLLAAFASCTTTSVRPIDATRHPISLICIEENPKVAVGEFLGVLEDRLLFYHSTARARWSTLRAGGGMSFRTSATLNRG